MRKHILLYFTLISFVLLSFSPVYAKDSYFTDVASDTKLCDAVNKLYEAKIILGYGDLTFRPNNNITRAELCKIVNMVFGYSDKADNTFVDVKESDWYYPYVLAAQKAGYIKGFEDLTFRGEEFVSREQFCAILNRTAKPFDLPFDTVITDEISDWAREDVYKIAASYLMPLEDNNTFRATQNITRAEVSLALAKFVSVDIPPADITPGKNTTGGSSGGSSTGGNPSDSDHVYTNDEIITTLKSLLDQLENIRFTSGETKIINEIKTAVTLAVKSGESGVSITPEYVKKEYKSYIDNVRSYKTEIGEEAFSNLKGKLVRELSPQTVNVLNEYFISN